MMRQSRPWIVFSVDCRRGLHARCLHDTEQFTAHCRYFVLCACDCHPRTDHDIEQLRRLRRDLTRSGEISGCFNPSLPQVWTNDDTAAHTGQWRRLNPLAELVELASRPATLIAAHQVNQTPATDIACGRDPDLATSIAVDTRTRVSKALECRACKEKRQVVEWDPNAHYQTFYAAWRLCAVCLLDALRLLLAKNITRSRTATKGETDGKPATSPDGDIAVARGKKAPRSVQRPRPARRIHQANRRRRTLRNKRYRTR